MPIPRLPSIAVLAVLVLVASAAKRDVLIAQSNDLLVLLDRGQLRDIGDEASDRNDQGGVFFGFINAGCSLRDKTKTLDSAKLTDYFLEKDLSGLFLGTGIYTQNRMYARTLAEVETDGGCDSARVQRIMGNLADLFRERMTTKSRNAAGADAERRRQLNIGEAVHSPVVVWCNSGYKAEDLVPVPAEKDPRSRGDCVWDILRGWARPLGMTLTPNSPEVQTFYEVMWKRDISARIACETKLQLGRPARDARANSEREDRILSCAASSSELARLKQELRKRKATGAASRERDAAEAAARRAQACDRKSEIPAERVANQAKLQDAIIRMDQAFRQFQRELAKERAQKRVSPSEAAARTRDKQAALSESFGINAIKERGKQLADEQLRVTVACGR